MKLNQGFISHEDGEDKLLVSTGAVSFKGLVRGNSSAGFIIDCLESDTTEDEIVSKMLHHFEVSEEIAKRDVHKIITQLKEIGAVVE
ncbi:MAG: PqqD family protein [Oscillospiraceae bacterium]|nr:PqqD family protein [Oscillospiraceae bacterium]